MGEIVDNKMILNDMGKIVEHVWNELPTHYFNIELGKFVVMPNHFHGILQIVGAGFARLDALMNNRAGEPRPYAPTLGNMVAYFKYQITKQINLPHKLWQRNYYEHIIRDNNDHARIIEYITNNPSNWNNDTFYISNN